MKTSITFAVLVLCFGAVIAFDVFTFFEREAGDRPIYIQTLQTIESEVVANHTVTYEWFGVNETFTQVYIETSSGVEMLTINRPANSSEPLYLRTFRLDIFASNTTQLNVNFIVFGFVGQPSTQPGANISFLGSHVNRAVERIVNHV